MILVRFVVFLTGLFTTVYAIVATVALAWGFVRFLVAAPAAIRHDLEAQRRRNVERQRPLRHVENEAVEIALEARPDPPALPPARS